MDRLTMFVPLVKADAAQRLVYGRFDESVDRAGEVFDYETSKPLIQAWSDEVNKASDGKSFGNIRAQHGKTAAGKLIEIEFDDMAKSVGFVAKIVDDAEWAKVEEGVYTGFSPGGRYAKRWQDGAHKRYTADIKELSIVDVPCNRNATFTLVKADGEEAEVEFVMDKAYEPGNEATLARADEMAKAAGKDKRPKDYVGKARAALIAEQADEALAKMSGDPDPVEPPAPTETADDRIARLEAALAKATGAGAVAEPEATDSVDLADITARGQAVQLLAKAVEDQPILAKGMYTLQRVGRALECLAEIATSVCYEEKAENDTDSKLPKMATALVGQVRDFLIEMANEETAELLTEMQTYMPDFVLVIPEAPVMELATQIVDMVKADGDRMEKAGARNSKGDQAKIQTIHDHATALGADCGTAEKDALAALTSDRDRLAKAVEDSVPQVEQLAKSLQDLSAKVTEGAEALAKANAEIEELKKQPMPPKGSLVVMEKGADVGTDEPVTELDRIRALPPGPAKAAALHAFAGRPQTAAR